MAVTQKQIAQALGVSHQLVSFALNGGGNVAEKTRQEILSAAEKMGYRRNELARAMATGKYKVIGLLRHHADEQFSLLLDGVLREADSNGYTVKVITRERMSLEMELIQRCAELRLAGLIGVQVKAEGLDNIYPELERQMMPLVVLDHAGTESKFHRVASGDVEAIKMVIDHLVDLGHQRMQFIGGAAPTRRQGFEQALLRHGLDVPQELPWCSYSDDKRIEEITTDLLRTDTTRPTAIVCISDPMAMVVCRTARSLGLEVPRDLSVTGYDDLFMAVRADPPLTTVAQPFHEMGRVAVQQLLGAIAQMSLSTGAMSSSTFDGTPLGIGISDSRSYHSSSKEQLLPTRLVVRGSTGPAPGGRGQ